MGVKLSPAGKCTTYLKLVGKTSKTNPIWELAKKVNIDICFDAEEADRLNLSLFLVEEILNSDVIDSEYLGFGIAVQAYQTLVDLAYREEMVEAYDPDGRYYRFLKLVPTANQIPSLEGADV